MCSSDLTQIPVIGVEPIRPQRTLDFESSASANSATPANLKIITGVAGFEPTHEGVKVPCLTAWLYPKNKGRMMGIEPTNAGATIRCVNHFATFAIIRYVILFLNKKLRWVHLSQYRRPGSNRHALNGHWILSPARMPIPPRRQVDLLVLRR